MKQIVKKRTVLGRISVGLALILLMTSGCVSAYRPAETGTPAPETSSDEEGLRAAYKAALENARTPTRRKISQQLVPISKDIPDLIWNEQGQVLMVTWSKSKYYKDIKEGERFQLYGDTWFTLVPFMKRFCGSFEGEGLKLRVEQNLGMPPGRDYDIFVEMWVDPPDVFRPCPDPETSDLECLVSVPLIGQAPESGPDKPPWYCGGEGPFARQRSMAYVVVSQTHLNWMCTNWTNSYTNERLYDNYPWTALGYTYDWGAEDPVGQSEYVVPGKTWVTLHSKTPTITYCGR